VSGRAMPWVEIGGLLSCGVEGCGLRAAGSAAATRHHCLTAATPAPRALAAARHLTANPFRPAPLSPPPPAAQVKTLDAQPVDISLRDRRSDAWVLRFKVYHRRMLAELRRQRLMARTRERARRAALAEGGAGSALGSGSDEDGYGYGLLGGGGSSGGEVDVYALSDLSSSAPGGLGLEPLLGGGGPDSAAAFVVAHAIRLDGSDDEGDDEDWTGPGGAAERAAAEAAAAAAVAAATPRAAPRWQLARRKDTQAAAEPAAHAGRGCGGGGEVAEDGASTALRRKEKGRKRSIEVRAVAAAAAARAAAATAAASARDKAKAASLEGVAAVKQRVARLKRRLRKLQ
jgi:hypothetical protein